MNLSPQQKLSLAISGDTGDVYNCLPAKCEDFVVNCTKCTCLSFPTDPDVCSKTSAPGVLPCFYYRDRFTVECTECTYRSFLDLTGRCSLCEDYINNCNSCTQLKDQTITCTACDYSYAVSMFDGSNCINCRIQIPNCLKCSFSKTQLVYICDECINNYVVIQDGSCVSCEDAFPNCEECEMNGSEPRCVKCSFGYGLIEKAVSVSKIDVCKFCHDVVPNCVVCTFETKDKVTCLACNEGLQMIAKNSCSNCTKIDPYCTMCTPSPNPTCTVCKSGMTFIDGKCRSCLSISGGCKRCVHSPKPYCTECIPGFYLTDFGTGATCVLCATKIEKCAECSSNGGDVVCSACKNGYYLVKNKKCEKLQSNLKRCKQYHLDSCSICVDGYVLVNHTCVSCRIYLLGCTKCTISGDSDIQCTECMAGYYLRNGECFACSKVMPNCRTCVPAIGALSTQEVICTSCAITYYLNITHNTCEFIIPNCVYFFKEESSVQCQTCLDGYQLSIDSHGNSSCVSVPSEETEIWLYVWMMFLLFIGLILMAFLPTCFKKVLAVKEQPHLSSTCDNVLKDKRH
ncbi:High cysteine membrane protein Group 2 [Giardia lamblia P15]|uniref:High cysteine membrane protein Group 2 n=1 Tax=Giardia intestinalis (strain P15) TaxID=658858 RepID=E1F683_GIAIA|nr:High cysteine membrane protein Group 2 [Giardia lamblia P15]